MVGTGCRAVIGQVTNLCSNRMRTMYTIQAATLLRLLY